MALGAKQFALVFEGFVEALGTRFASFPGISFFTIALSVALTRAVALANAVARAICARQAFLAEVVGWTAHLEGVDAEPFEEV